MAQLRNFVEFAQNALAARNAYVDCDRKFVITEHMKLLNSAQGDSEKVVMTFAAPNRSLPIIPLEKTNMISVEDILRAGRGSVHEGKFFLCRSILPQAKSPGLAVALVVDDPAGQGCLRVSLCNFSGIIRPGTILVIMHPWFDLINGMAAAIRVGNPQHVRIIIRSDPLIQDLIWEAPLPEENGVTEEKQPEDDPAWEGNNYFVDKNYPPAVEAYSKAIEAHPRIPVLYSNRAMTYLKMEKPDKALEDTEIGLKLEPSNLKLLYRKGKALIGLKQYEEAARYLEKVSKEHKEALKEKVFADLVKASKRMKEEARGNYDIMKMFEEAKRSKLLDNHADYYALDKFEVKEVPGKGRGLVAKEKIEMGTLLMAGKAFVFADVAEESVTVVNLSTMTQESSTFAPMVRKACEKLLNNPELGDDFYKLNAGGNLGWLEKADRLNPVDMERISGIIGSISFSVEDLLTDYSNITELPPSDGGLWIMPSYLNHSCVDWNCTYFFIGDFMFVRAIRDISPGEELLVGYCSPWGRTYEDRRLDLLKSFGFECSCSLCQIDRNDSEKVRNRFRQIDIITKEILQRFYLTDIFLPRDVALLRDLLEEATKYRRDGEFNIVADLVRKTLAAALGNSSPVESYKLRKEIFDTRRRAGDLRSALNSAKILAATSLRLGDMKEMVKWMKMGRELARFMFGHEELAHLMEIN